MKTINLKRIKTCAVADNAKWLDSGIESNTEGDTKNFNITINKTNEGNNNIVNQNSRAKNVRRNFHKSKFKYRRHKTEFFETKEEQISNIINRIIVKNSVKNLNININYNECPPSRKVSNSAEKTRTLMLWKKTINFQRMVNAFLHPKAEKIDDDIIFDSTLKDTLFGINNQKLNRRNSPSNKDYEITLGQFLRKSEVEKEFIRIQLKEKAYLLITEGSDNPEELIESFEKLFRQNPEKSRYSPDDRHFLFNQPLSNGKTLLYIACQERIYDAVNYFLLKGLNPNIRSKYYDQEDTCLWVACRWGYYDIVELLLETNKIDPLDIKEEIEKKDCNHRIIQLLIKYLPKEYKRGKKGCACF